MYSPILFALVDGQHDTPELHDIARSCALPLLAASSIGRPLARTLRRQCRAMLLLTARCALSRLAHARLAGVNAPVVAIVPRDDALWDDDLAGMGVACLYRRPLERHELASVTTYVTQVCRRSATDDGGGGITLDPDSLCVTCREKCVHLTPTEFALLHALVNGASRAVARHALVQDVWGDVAPSQADAILAVHASQLRAKLRRLCPRLATSVKAVRGFGYAFTDDWRDDAPVRLPVVRDSWTVDAWTAPVKWPPDERLTDLVGTHHDAR